MNKTARYTSSSHRRLLRLLLILGILSAICANAVMAAASIVQTFYMPITEEQIRTWEDGIYGGTIGNDVNTVISITATFNNTVIYYDQWEDGYEEDISNPVQSTTLTWGDGNASNGAPPDCSSDACDVVNAGTVIALQNVIPANPRDQGNIFFDAEDKFASTGQLVVTRSGWATNPGTVFAGAAEVFDIRKWSTSYESPIGTNSPAGVVGSMFTYTAISVQAKDDNTIVQVDSDADGSVDNTTTLNQGASMMVTNIYQGATVNASAPVQVDLMTGQIGSNVVGRWLSLIHRDEWGSSYYSPVMTTSAQTNSVILYNPDPSAIITVNIDTASGPQTPINIGPRQVARFDLTTSGAHFYTSGAPFFGVLIGDYNSSTGLTYEWGAMLVPEQDLTPAVIVGWAPGSDGNPPAQNISPVWVTATANTTLYVDYDGNPATGSNTDPLGNHYDVSYNVTALQSQRIYDPDFNMTGARIYTVNGTRLAAVWGQDASNGIAVSPSMDLGTAVLPFPSLTAYKTASIIGDYNNNGGLDAGELLEYTIRVHNSGIYPITDVTLTDTLDSDVTYVADTTAIAGIPVADDVSPKTRFPFDETGYIIVTSPAQLNPGDDMYITFQVTANNPLPPSKLSIMNTAKVESIAEIFLNSQTALVRQGALQTTMTSSVPPGTVKPGDTITYTVTVENISPAPQTGIQLSGPLPDGTSYVPNSTTVTGPRQKYVADRFNQLLYGNNDGPENWAGNWSEDDTGGGGPTGGNVQVINGTLRLSVTGSSASRTVDLTTGIPGQNFSSAVLSFDFRTSPGVDAADAVEVEISSDGSSFTTLETFTGISGQTSGTRSYDISSYISANTTVRFSVSGGFGGTNEYFYPDNVAIKTNELPAPVTKDNVTGGANPDLISGVPPTLILPADGFSLAPGETLTVTYSVVANNPVNETRIVNTVTATSHEKAPPASATTVDPVGIGGTIGDLVWLDTIVNGAYDHGEPGLYNVRVWLDTNDNGIFDTGTDFETRTGTDGKYIFPGLIPGTYRVFVDETTIPAGLDRTTGTVNPSSPVIITDVEVFSGIDFGFRNAGAGVAVVGDYVWSDADNDGVQDPGETGLGGVTMQLATSPGDIVVQTATTNAFGIYLFTNVLPGTYVVKSDTAGILAGYTPSVGLQSIGKKDSDPLTVSGGNSYVMMDFGYYHPSLFSISNRLWFDSNDNGTLDAGEPGIKDVTVTLLDPDGYVMGATLTDTNGNLSFTGVSNGSYTIRIEDASGKLIGFAGTTAAAQNGLLSVTVAGANVTGTAFGYNAPGRIGDKVWNDLNRNGIQDAGETGIQGVIVQLYKDTNGDGIFNPATDQSVSTTTSDSDGNYMFQVSEAGRFFSNVDDTQPALAGMTFTTGDDEPYQGVQRQIDFLTLDISFLTADFGFSDPAVISGTVWSDTNRSGSRDSGETGIQGVSVGLYRDTNGDGVFDPAVDQLISALLTDFNGNYVFPSTEAGRFFISTDDTQAPLLGMTLTTIDDQAYQGAQITVNLPDVNTFFTTGNFGFGPPAPSALSITKTADPAGDVNPGDTITYTVTVTNTSATRQTGIRINDPLPANTTYVANSTSVTGPLPSSTSTISDNFETGTYSGGIGWSGNWVETGDDGNPAGGDIQIATDLGDRSARIRQTSNILTRQVNLSTCTTATVTFNYRRQGFDWTSDYVAFSVYNGSWTEVARFAGPGTDTSYVNTPAYNISTNTTQIRFLSAGMNNQDYFFFDNIQIVCSTPKTLVTKTNQISAPNPLTDGNPPNLVVPADGFILDQNDSLVATFRVTVDNPLPPDADKIINQATATSNESGPAIASVINRAPLLQDLQVTKTVSSISDPCVTGTCQVTYLVTATNVGRNAETNIEVTDNLPSQLQYLSNTPSQGSYASGTGIWSIGNLGSGSSATLQITAQVTGFQSSIQNCARLTASVPSDTNPGNDSGCVSITPTHVFISGFGAYEDNGRMVIEWTTSSENGTAGFYLFRKDEATGSFQRLNRRMLPALLTSPLGGIYSLIDNAASPHMKHTYALIEMENSGAKKVYGPFTVSAGEFAEMENPGMSGPIDPDILLNFANNTPGSGDKIAQSVSVDGTMTYSNSKNSNSGISVSGGDLYSGYTKTVNETAVSRTPVLKTLKYTESEGTVKTASYGSKLKISLSKDGLYFLPAAKIASVLGYSEQSVNIYIKYNLFSLTSQGQPVAYSHDNNGTGILFYGRSIQSIYTDENVYWLSLGTGLPMASITGTGPSPASGDITFTETVHAEENRIVVPVLFDNPEADYWFWDVIVSEDPVDGMKEFTVNTNGREPSAEALLTISLQGFTDAKHHIVVSLNGADNIIGSGTWEGSGPKTFTFDCRGLLKEGENSVEIKGIQDDQGAIWSIFYVDSIDLTYQRLYHAFANTLVCRGEGHSPLTINGFTGPDILLFDITDPFKPRTVMSRTISGTDGDFAVSFTPSSPGATYLAVTNDAVLSVDRIQPALQNTLRLKSTNNYAEYVVICRQELAEAAGRLASYRKKQGLHAKVVLIEDLMNEFNDGIYDPRTIRTFLSYAYHNWIKPPKYVVLAGNGTFDYKDNMDKGDNMVPTLMAPTPMGLYPSDNLFAEVDEDAIPKMAVGRLPVMTRQEFQDVVRKIISYESTGGNLFVTTADIDDDGGNFTADSDAVAALAPQKYAVEKIYLSQHPIDEARSLLMDSINRGAIYLNFIGHSGPAQMGKYGLLTKEDLSAISNTKGLHILTAMTCLMGQYGIPGYDSLSESLLLTKGSGSVAVWSPSGYSFNASARILDEEFFKAAFSTKKTLLGDALLKAFTGYNTAGGQRFMIDIYNLQGDPALKLK